MGNELPLTAATDALEVHLAFDDEAKVWYIAQSDIPGLHLEAKTPLDLLHRIIESAPELIELNASQDVAARAESLEAGRPIIVRPVFDAPLELTPQ